MIIELLSELSRWLKNEIGSFKGYSGCPNCGNNWWWTERRSIPYASEIITDEEQTIDEISGEIVSKKKATRPIVSSVLICSDCLKSHEKLDPQKIKDDLIRYQWSEQDAEAVRKAVIVYIDRQKEIELVNAS